jgi:hypothetical protein
MPARAGAIGARRICRAVTRFQRIGDSTKDAVNLALLPRRKVSAEDVAAKHGYSRKRERQAAAYDNPDSMHGGCPIVLLAFRMVLLSASR